MSVSRNILFAFGVAVLAISAPPATAAARQDENLQSRMERFREARDDFRQHPNDLERRQELLLRAIDTLITHAELLRERADVLAVPRETAAAPLSGEIADEIATLQQFRDRAQSAASRQELKELAAELHQHHQQVQTQIIRKFMLLRYVSVFEHRILEIASLRAASIAEKLDEFGELGKEVDTLETLLEQANGEIAQAAADLTLLKNTVITADRINTELLQETQNTMRGINAKVKEAYHLFRQIAREAAEL